MTTDKVTTAILEEMAVGETRVFRLPQTEPYRTKAVVSGQSLACRFGRANRCKFKTSADYVNNTITVTKKPQPEKNAGEGGEG